jgi:alpha-tubulin suppressor-like RCC1 family protein
MSQIRTAAFLFGFGTALGACDNPTSNIPEPEAVMGEAGTASGAVAPTFYQVSAGWSHSCGVSTDNLAYCWGSNGSGELGDGTTDFKLKPVPVSGGLRFRQVSAGASSTCGVTTDNRAYCWGFNNQGQLGDGTSGTDRLMPVSVTGGRQYRRIETSGNHTCGLTYPGNQAYCWGHSTRGEIGDGTRGENRLFPVAVLGGLRFRQLSVGRVHTCAVTLQDRAFCWGSDRYGQIGDSMGGMGSFNLTPSQVAGGHHFRQIWAGGSHTCAVTTGDQAFCWGKGDSGQLGTGKLFLSTWPRRVAGQFSFKRVTAGYSHTCATTTSNRAYCWGFNGNGRLGDGTLIDRLTPARVAGGLSFEQMSAGPSHTCGKTPAEVAYCWGDNDGKLGDGTITDRLTPSPVAGAM